MTFADGCKVYSREDRIRCLECFATVQYLDSVIALKDSAISNCNRFTIDLSNEINELNTELKEKTIESETQRKKKRTWIKVAFSAIGVAILETTILIVK